jgi:hypothetical protein
MIFAQLVEAKKNFVARAVNNELILVPLKNQVADMTQLFTLNELGHFIWNHLDEQSSIESITQKITAEYDINQDAAREDLVDFLNELTSFMFNDKA